MKKTVAIIGATGNVGSAISLGLATAGYRVLLTDEIEKQPFLYVKLLFLEYRIRSKSLPVDVEMIISEREASWEADIIVFVVPGKARAGVARKIKDVVTGKIVVSVISPLNKGHNGLVTAAIASTAEELAGLLPHSKIVKACTIDSPSDFKIWEKAGTIPDVIIAGDDTEAVSTIMQLIKDAGFNPLFAGQRTVIRNLENTVQKTDRSSNEHVPN